MTSHYILLLICGAAAGGFINGLAGFGTALLALGFWLQIMTPTEAVALVLFMSVVSGVPGVWMVRDSVIQHKRRLLRFLLPAIVGIPLGVAALAYIDARTLKLIVAGLLILYGGFFTFRKKLPMFIAKTPVIDALIGFTGGVLGGAAGLSGAIPTMWCAMRPWTKEETRAVVQPYNTSVLFLSMLAFAWKGFYEKEDLVRIAIIVPITLLSAYVGMAIFKRLSDNQFRRLVISLMLVAGLILSFRELL